MIRIREYGEATALCQKGRVYSLSSIGAERNMGQEHSDLRRTRASLFYLVVYLFPLAQGCSSRQQRPFICLARGLNTQPLRGDCSAGCSWCWQRWWYG